MSNAAIVSHCCISPSISEPYVWLERKGGNVLLVQGSFVHSEEDEHVLTADEIIEATHVIKESWKKVQEHLDQIDVLVMYLGKNAYETSIDLAASSGIAHEKIIFVSCPCYCKEKRRYAKEHNMMNVRWFQSKCGGGDVLGIFYASQVTFGCVCPNLKL